MAFPENRLRRLRYSPAVRDLVRETSLTPSDIILPLFVTSARDDDRPIAAMPGSRYLSGKPLIEFAHKVRDHGVPAVLLFGVLEDSEKDMGCSSGCSPDGAVQRAMSELKDVVPGLLLIADLCLCEYRPDGHCGVYENGIIDNDQTLAKLGEISVSFAGAGADVIAPSCMMDGQVLAIREALDENGFINVMTMPYSAKFNSAFYGPFKAGTGSNPAHGLHHTHQMAVANGREAMREIELDLEEGADMIIVKPAVSSLDVIRDAKERYGVPTAAYHVSGEQAMIRAAGERGFIDADAVTMETLLCIKRAGADMIITYDALEAAARLQGV